MRAAVLVVAVVSVILLGAAVSSLVRNNPPWMERPGFAARLQHYLTTHLAETHEGTDYPELRPRHYTDTPPDQLYAAVEKVARRMTGWTVAQTDPSQRVVRSVVVSPIMHFKDDVTVRVLADEQRRGSILHVSSESRVGKGDLAANTRHVLDLYAALDAIIPPPDAAYKAQELKTPLF